MTNPLPSIAHWPPISDLKGAPSPSLLIDPLRIEANIQRMISLVGADGIDRLRPHLKTHKMAEVVQLQCEAGITRFKAATLAELEMAAEVGAKDVLLAMQAVGPNIARLVQAVERYPEMTISTIVDHPQAVSDLSRHCRNLVHPLGVFIDIDCGMHRTGIELGPELDALASLIEEQDGVTLAGYHLYDGHLHDPAEAVRRAGVLKTLASVTQLTADSPELTVIVGGSPTFGLWAKNSSWECSPGTTLLWDAGYAQSFPDLPFDIAAVLLTRIVSKPGDKRLCLDLGHKAVAAENPLECRVFFPALPDVKILGQSEEHLVVETEDAGQFSPGDLLYALPRHICPTVALHHEAHVIRKKTLTEERWIVAARRR